MNELTDLEIRKLISIFELNQQFPKAKSIEFDASQNCFWVDSIGFTSWPLLDPLTDDALCFKLMVKHSIRVEPENCSAWTDNDDGYPQYEVIHCKGTINKAICLAIIKSKE
jgi:hypothetical protein